MTQVLICSKSPRDPGATSSDPFLETRSFIPFSVYHLLFAGLLFTYLICAVLRRFHVQEGGRYYGKMKLDSAHGKTSLADSAKYGC